MPNNTNTTSRYGRLKNRVRETFKSRVNLAKKNSDTNSWNRLPNLGTPSLFRPIINSLKMSVLHILPALVAKKGQEQKALRELSQKLFNVNIENITSHKGQNLNKALNGWWAVMNILAWPHALLKLGIVSFNLIVDTLDLTISSPLLKLIMRLTPSQLKNSEGKKYTDKIEELITNLKKTGSLPARVIKRLVNFAEIIPSILLSAPIHIVREIDALFDKSPESAGTTAVSDVQRRSTGESAASHVNVDVDAIASANVSTASANQMPSTESSAVANDSEEVLETSSPVPQEVHPTATQTVSKLSLADQQKPKSVETSTVMQSNAEILKPAERVLADCLSSLHQQGFFATSNTRPSGNNSSETHEHSRAPTPIAV